MENENIVCCKTTCENPLDQNYWNEKWLNNETGWDIGQASPPIVEYMKQYPNKNIKILIPGCGNAYEAEFLYENGFRDITLIDIAPKAVEILQEKFKNNPEIKVLCQDFFEHTGNYDLIIEQTFFCAIPPARRKEYAEKAFSLLNPNGKLIGVLFDKQFNQPFPPFGGCPCEYKPIFQPYFEIKTMETCYNSIPSRANSELFINFKKIS
jgi:SAM-dependent methyltransferase